MNYKHVFLIFVLVVLFLSVTSCADKEAADAEETADETKTTEESAIAYDPDVVDQLTEDLDEMSW